MITVNGLELDRDTKGRKNTKKKRRSRSSKTGNSYHRDKKTEDSSCDKDRNAFSLYGAKEQFPDYTKEKADLQDCNSRLERYIISQKDKENRIFKLEDTINKLTENLADEKGKIRQTVKKSYDELRNQKNKLENEILSQTSRNDKIKKELRTSKVELKMKTQNLKSMEARILDLIKSQETNRSMLSRLKDLTTKYKNDKEKYFDEAKLLRNENEALQQERVVAQKSFNDLQSRFEKRKLDSKFSDKTYKAMVSSYEKEINEYKKKAQEVEEELRLDFAEQLNETLKARQKGYDEDKNRALKELSKFYEGKIEDVKKQKEEGNKKFDTLKANFDEKKQEFKKANADKEILRSRLDVQNKQVALLEKKVKALKLKPIRKEQHNAHVLKMLKEAYRKKEQDCEMLLDLKVALTLEIQQYRELLDREENRITTLRETRRSSITPLGLKLKTDGSSDSDAPLQDLKSEASEAPESVQSKRESVKKPIPESKVAGIVKHPKKRKLKPRRSSGRPEGVLKKIRDNSMTQATEVTKEKKKAEVIEETVRKKSHEVPENQEGSPSEAREEKASNQGNATSKVKPGREKDVEEIDLREEVTEESESLIECISNDTLIEITNRSDTPLMTGIYKFHKPNDPSVAPLPFPTTLALNEKFIVYATQKDLEESTRNGIKKVWCKKAFATDGGNVCIVDGKGNTRYEFEINSPADIV